MTTMLAGGRRIEAAWHGPGPEIAPTLVFLHDGIGCAARTGRFRPAHAQLERLVAADAWRPTRRRRQRERALDGVGVGWVKTVDNYRVGEVAKVLKDAMSTDYKGLKVIIAEGECQLERQRKLRPVVAKDLAEGKRTVRVKYGVDEDTCTGDHSCIRLSGCPTLTVKDNPDPLRRDPVATVIDGCVGCGLCGENAHAAVLCPSFYRAEVVQNPNALDRFLASLTKLLRGKTIH